MGQAVARKLNADHCDEQGSHLPCKCGAEARLAGRRPKTFTTALGPLTLERAWYHCERCHHGFSPRDRALGMEHTFVSPAALRMMGIAAARTSFAGASALLRELAGLTLAPKTVERHAEALGREVATDESRVIEPEPCDAPTVYLGLDGTGVPARKTEVEGHCGKQPDGTAKTREAKLAVVWSAQTTDNDGRPVRDPGSATYNAAIESIATRYHHRPGSVPPRTSHVPTGTSLGTVSPSMANTASPHEFPPDQFEHSRGHESESISGYFGSREASPDQPRRRFGRRESVRVRSLARRGLHDGIGNESFERARSFLRLAPSPWPSHSHTRGSGESRQPCAAVVSCIPSWDHRGNWSEYSVDGFPGMTE